MNSILQEKWGLRLVLATTGSLLTILMLLLMLFTEISPIACYVFMGVFYCLAVVSTFLSPGIFEVFKAEPPVFVISES